MDNEGSRLYGRLTVIVHCDWLVQYGYKLGINKRTTFDVKCFGINQADRDRLGPIPKSKPA